MAERNPSKQKRAAQNKAQREALAARRERAGAPRAARAPEPGIAADEDVEAAPRRRSRFRASSAPTESGRPSRSAPARAPTRRSTGTTSSTTTGGGRQAPAPRGRKPPPEIGPDQPEEAGIRGFFAHLQQIAGGKALLFSFIFAVVAAATVLLASVIQRTGGIAMARIVHDVIGGTAPKDAYEQTKYVDHITLTQAVGPIGLLYAALPVVIAGAALESSRRAKRRRNFTISAFVLGLYVVFFSFIGIFFFFSMAGLFFAAYQARKADPPAPRAPRRRASDAEDEEDEDDEDA